MLLVPCLAGSRCFFFANFYCFGCHFYFNWIQTFGICKLLIAFSIQLNRNTNREKLKEQGFNRFGMPDTVNVLDLVIVEIRVYFDNIMHKVMSLKVNVSTNKSGNMYKLNYIVTRQSSITVRWPLIWIQRTWYSKCTYV